MKKEICDSCKEVFEEDFLEYLQYDNGGYGEQGFAVVDHRILDKYGIIWNEQTKEWTTSEAISLLECVICDNETEENQRFPTDEEGQFSDEDGHFWTCENCFVSKK